MRGMNTVGFSGTHGFGLDGGGQPKNLKILFGITQLDFHQSSASLSWQIVNVGFYRQNPPPSNAWNDAFNFGLQILNETVFYKFTVDAFVFQYVSPLTQFYVLQNKNLNCQVISQGVGYRSENYTFQMNSPSMPDYRPQARQIYAALYYRGFNLFNPNGSYFYINWEFYYNFTHYTFVFHTQDQNLVSFVNFDAVIVDINDAYQIKNYIRYFIVDMGNCSFPSAYSCPDKGEWTFPNYDVGFKSYLIGLTKLNFTKHQPTKWFMNTTDIADLTPGHFETASMKWFNQTVFIVAQLTCLNPAQFYDPQTKTCVATCASPMAYFLAGATPGGQPLCLKCHYSCVSGQCTGPADTDCTTCNTTKNRQSNGAGKCQCPIGYIDVGVQYCPPCTYYIPGCLQCSSTTVCTSCSANMFITSNNTCQCSLVQTTSRYGTCQGIVGCLVYFNDPVRSTVCIQCNVTQNFVLFNYTCDCIAGYGLQSIGGKWVCFPLTQVCGDGIRTVSEQCDDFNTISGDGCNSTCAVEIGFICFGNLRETSFCIENISTIQYVGTMKIEGQSTADLYFQLWPYNQRLQDVQILSKYLQTSISNISSMYNLQIFTEADRANDKLRIRLRYDYNQDINPGIQQNLSLFVYDRSKQLTIPTKFYIVGANLKLAMVESQGNLLPLNYVMLVLVILAFLAMFISLFTQNWIGIQLLHTFQFCFFYYVLLGQIDQKQYRYLNYLEFCNGFNRLPYYFSYYEYIDFNRKIYLLDFSKEILLNFNFTAFLFCLPILLLMWKFLRNLPSLYAKVRTSKGTSQGSQRNSGSPKLDYLLSSEFIIGKVFITINLICMNIIIFSFFIMQTHFYQQADTYIGVFQQFYLFFLMTSIVMTVGILLVGAINPFRYYEVSLQEQQDAVGFVRFKRFSPNYPIIFTSVAVLKIVLVSLFSNNSYGVYILLSIEIAYLIGFLMLRPYIRQRSYEIKYCYQLHNLHNIWNSFGLIVLLIVLIIANGNGNSGTYPMNAAIKFVIFSIQLISLILAYMRIFTSKRLARIAKNIEDEKQQNNSPLEGYEIENTDRPLRRNTSSSRKNSTGQRSISKMQQQKSRNRPRQSTGNSFRSNSPNSNRIRNFP